jgi:NhaP-type Na+/H+ or K+/H+ antiporter
MLETALIVSALAVFVYALVARRVSGWMLTPPLVFLILGFGLNRAGLLHVEYARDTLHVLAEATLVIVLFSDAAAIDLEALRTRHVWPFRMLVIGLPLSILLGGVAAYLLLPSWTVWELVLLAAILAPTDAALGQAVVTNPTVPERVRRALSVESGLNDGLALPAILFFGCLAVGGVHDQVQSSWLVYALQQIGLGCLTGAAVGWVGGSLMRWSARRGWSSETFEGLGVLALAALAFLAAETTHGNGFIAAFVAGLVFGYLMKGRCKFVFEFMEAEGQALILLTFLLVGGLLLPGAIAVVGAGALILILISLFLVRPIAIWLSLLGTDADPVTRGFMGWFGPRGLATVLFALLVVADLDELDRGEEILAIAVVAVGMSALLHGMSAAPAARWFGRRSSNMRRR